MTHMILLIGSGGREHAMAWKLAASEQVKHVFVAPGNGGTEDICKVSNIALAVKNHEEIIQFCKTENIDLVVVGPEDPLANGLSDDLKNSGISCFGPSKDAAAIEASKAFAKAFMDGHQIPTARWQEFTDVEAAKKHILSAPYDALVVKASGLAAGKGVVVADSRESAVAAVDHLRDDLHSASEIMVIEELLSGEEVSVLCFTDGTDIVVMPPAQDHKRLLDGDKGPNTGGMGAFCPCPQVSADLLDEIKRTILQRAVDGMKKDGKPYIGVLYAGLMLTKDGPKVLEFNCRFGDPETQVILPLLNTDLFEVLRACVNGSLRSLKNIAWKEDRSAVGVVIVSGGYPGSYPKGKEIKGLDKLKNENLLVFHAGTAVQSKKLVTSGGRVLCVVAISPNLKFAASKALESTEKVDFEGAFCRKDIARKAIDH